MNNTVNEPNQPSAPQETTVIHAAAPASAQSNANLILILVLFVILLIGAAVAFALKNKNDDSRAEKDLIKAQIAAIRGGDDSMLAKGASLDARITSIVDHANKIRTDYDSMKAGYTTSKQSLENTKKELAGNMNTITRLSSSLNKLQNENTQLKALASSAKSHQQQANMLRDTLIDKDKLIATLQGGPTPESMQLLQNSLKNEREAYDEIKNQLTENKRRMTGMVDRDQVADAEKLRRENERLRNQLAALQAKVDFAKLFVTSHDQLPLTAQSLFNELKQLERASPTELASAYTKIGSNLQAENLQRVKFASGSALLNFKDQNVLKSNLVATNTDDYFLVVGYASTSGDASTNQTLSANRATSVASLVNQLKKQGQDVRAVYLGQTKRFSKTNHSENQLCEIWRIRKQ